MRLLSYKYMGRIVRKASQCALTLFLVVTINFFMIRMVPGDVLVGILGEAEYIRLQTDFPEELDVIREKYGLDETIGVQYLRYLRSILRLDFGYSYANKQPVAEYVLYHMRWTLILLFPVIVLSALIGGMLGLRAGWHGGGRLDKLLTPIAILLSNIPANFISILFLMLFSFRLKWFPLGGMTSGGLTGVEKIADVAYHMVLPGSIMIFFRSCSNFLSMKSYTMQVMGQEFITTAVSKGVPDTHVLRRHVIMNLLPSYLTLLCMQFGHIFSGSMVLETIFSWRGMGILLQTSAQSKDYPVLQFSILLIAATVLFFNMLSDLLCLCIDPRIRQEEGTA